MPFYQAVSQEDTMVVDNDASTKKKKRYPKIIYIFAFFYFAFSCGMEGFFQSQTFWNSNFILFVYCSVQT